jgi:hypothetical protein
MVSSLPVGSAQAAHLLMHEHVDILAFLVEQLTVELELRKNLLDFAEHGFSPPFKKC